MYPCTKCGACCKMIYKSPIADKNMLNNDGSCKYLVNNSCSIYENRPEFCNVKIMYEKYYKNDYSLLQFYQMNAEVCNQLQELLLIDQSYRILKYLK